LESAPSAANDTTSSVPAASSRLALISKERVGAFFDAVVAISATLLVFDINIPASDGTLKVGDLIEAGHELGHWIVSFAMVALIWVEFNFVLSHSRQSDGAMLLLTLALVAALSLIPFASSLVGDHPENVLGALVFTGVMSLNGFLVIASAALLKRKMHLHERADSHHQLALRIRAQLLVFIAVVVVCVTGVFLHRPEWGVFAWIGGPMILGLVLRKSTPHATRRQEITS
jgi:uncharacterized membrane protein